MTAVANPSTFQPINRSAWGANGMSGGLSSIHDAEVSLMFQMPRKSAQRANSSSSVSSNSSSASSTSSSSSGTTTGQATGQSNGASIAGPGDPGGYAGTRKKPPKAGPWPPGKSEPSSVGSSRAQAILTTNGVGNPSSTGPNQLPSAIVPSQNLQTQQHNGVRVNGSATGEGNPVLHLLSMNGTFERKTINVPFYPEVLRIGRQTNAKTVPTPTNGFFDSKVLSRQHAEIWADKFGKIWIRDVRSSNGTFVNATRLSAENRESEPHELQTQDHLELGIDIVSEDQKTVVHHKVAAKVEYAGPIGPSNNVLDMNFGDLDPANGPLNFQSPNNLAMLPPNRGRGSSQGSVNSNGRMGPPGSVASNMTNGQRPMNFWLSPVTTEQIVKRLTQEIRSAKLQSTDLLRTEQFMNTIFSREEFKDSEKPPANDAGKLVHVNGAALPFKIDPKPRFSDPPAPPPQQPLPEKPDVSRSSPFDNTPGLKRSVTERPRSVPNVPHDKPEQTSQIMNLVEALATAKKEIDSQNVRMRELEVMLQKEREARESAEGLAKRLEESSSSKMNGVPKGGADGSVLEEAFEPPADSLLLKPEVDEAETAQPGVGSHDPTRLQEKLELLMAEMGEMKQQMEAYRLRAETAEAERETHKQTLAEMVEKIRADELRRSHSVERGRSPSHTSNLFNPLSKTEGTASTTSIPSTKEIEALFTDASGRPLDPAIVKSNLAMALTRPPDAHERLLYHSAPYASMLGVVLIGMGLMAYLNGWQKVER